MSPQLDSIRRSSRCRHRVRAGGFTLIEVLVVMVLIAIVVSLATVRFQRDDRQILREEAVRLAALLTHARDEAITTGVPLGWRGEGTGYRFFRRGPDRQWLNLTGDDVLRPRELTAPMQLVEVKTVERAAETGPSVVFMPSAANRPFQIVIELNGARVRVRADLASEIRVEDASG
jgi:general secretion pathway protein H